MPYWSQMAFIAMMDSILSFSNMAPKAPSVSYSGFCAQGMAYGPLSTRTIPLQCSGQPGQVTYLTRYLMTLSSLIASALGISSGPEPPQFRTGQSPLKIERAVPAAVPYLLVLAARGSLATSAMISRISARISASSARGTGCVPRAAIALRRLAPITAPSPDRPAALPLSVITQAISDCCSPAGPTMPALMRGSPSSSLSRSSACQVVRPHRCEASRSSTRPSLIHRYTGCSAWPRTKTASYPARLRLRARSPPELESPQVPVRGDLPTI